MMRSLGLILCLGALLAGCSNQPAPELDTDWQQQAEQGLLHARIDPQQQAQLQRALTHKGLLLPAVQLTDQNTLAPDYPLSALQWASLQQRLGLRLDSAGRSLRRYRYLLKQVNEQCPEQARRPSASCQILSLLWLDGFIGDGALPAESLVETALNEKAAYLVVSNPDLYTLGLMRHAQSGMTTQPITEYSLAERKLQLTPLLQSARLELWLPEAEQPAFSCQLRPRSNDSDLQRQWQTLQQDLLDACEPALIALLGLELNEVPPSLTDRQQDKLKKLLKNKDRLFR